MPTLTSEMVTIAVDGQQMPAYLSRDASKTSQPGVVVLQEIFGVNNEMKRIADLLAAEGYAAVVPNFYFRAAPDLNAPYNPEGQKEGFAAAMTTTKETLTADVQASIDYLNAQPWCNASIGVWGFCFGGSIAYMSASMPGVRAAVSFYGGQIAESKAPARPAAIEVTPAIKAPVFLAFGGADASIPPEAIAKIESALKENKKQYEIEVYPAEGHAFFRNGVNAESTAGARDVWPKVQAFLKQHLQAS